MAIPDNVHEAVTELDTVVFAGDGIAGHMSATNRYNGDAPARHQNEKLYRPLHTQDRIPSGSDSGADVSFLV